VPVSEGSSGFALLCIAALGIAVLAYGSSYLTEYWPTATTFFLVAWPLLGLALGVGLVCVGVVNPWRRAFVRWRRVSLDWKDLALQAEDRLDKVAQAFTGEDDPSTARRLMDEQLERPKKGRGRGRPRGSRTDIDEKTWREKAQEIHKLRRQGMAWDNIGMRLGISGDTARDWYRCLEEEEPETA
jgi:hypothetical protein